MARVAWNRVTREQAIAEGWFEPNDSGVCQCGCGQPAQKAASTARRYGYVGGEYMRYLRGHGQRNGHQANENNPRWKGDDVSYSALHTWVGLHFTRAGVCDECGIERGFGRSGTHWHNVTGEYRRDRADWQELCPKCHVAVTRRPRSDADVQDCPGSLT